MAPNQTEDLLRLCGIVGDLAEKNNDELQAEILSLAVDVGNLKTALRRLLHHAKAITVYVSPQDDEEDAAVLHKFEVACELAEEQIGE